MSLASLCLVAPATTLLASPAGASPAPGTVTPVDNSAIYEVLASGGGYFFARTIGCVGDDQLLEYNRSGTIVNSFDLGYEYCGPEFAGVASNGTYVATVNAVGILYVIDIATNVVSTYDLSSTLGFLGYFPSYFLAMSTSTVYVSGPQSSGVAAVDLSTDSLTWSQSVPVAGGPIALDGTTLVVAGATGLSTFDATTGAPGPSYDTGFYPSTPTSALAADGNLYLTFASGGVASFTLGTFVPLSGALAGSETYASYFDGSHLWVSDLTDGMVYELSPTTLNVLSGYSLTDAFGLAGIGNQIWADEEFFGGIFEITPATLAAAQTPTTTVLSLSSSSSPVFGQPVTVTATVSTPGTVSFFADGQAVTGCDKVPATTTATCTWTPTSTGAHALTARLAPSGGTYAPSTSPALSITVASAPTSVTLAGPSGIRSVAVHRATPVTATVSTPGTVTFYDGGTIVDGCVGLPATTTATCTWTPTSTGAHALTARLAPYSPNYSGSTASTSLLVVASTLRTVLSPLSPGSSTLTISQRHNLEHFVLQIRRDGYSVVTVVGHGDGGSVGASLGRARAQAVATLVRQALGASASSVRVAVAVGASAGSRVTVIASLS